METVDLASDTLIAQVEEMVRRQNEVDLGWQALYFEARCAGCFDAAVAAGPHSRTQALRMTRAENEKRGRSVRWGER